VAMHEHVALIGRTKFRNDRRRFGIEGADRLFHLYIIGKTGTGKSTLIESLARQDIVSGRGLALLDPHGDLVERLAPVARTHRSADTIYLNATDSEQPYGYNPLRHVAPEYIPLAASGLLETFRKLWPDAWGVRMEHVLRNTLYALLEQPDATLSDVLRMLSTATYRKSMVARIANPVVQAYWRDEFEKYSPRFRADSIAPIQNKVGAFLADPRLQRILTSPAKDLHIRQIMDRGGVFLVNLARGHLGEDTSSLLGALLMTTIGLAAFSRAVVPAEERRPFFLYIDEFQNFTTTFLATMLSELRKYQVGLTLAHQHLAQLSPDVRGAIFGNVGTLISFRVGADDAPILAREFEPRFRPQDLIQLPNYDIYVRLMIEGTPSRPFSGATLPLD
jgi:hypothetical protein